MSVVASPPRVELRLKQRYQDKIVPTLIQRFAYTNVMQVPRLVKVVANIGVGESIQNPKALEVAQGDRELQAARWPAHRRQGDASRRPHVPVRRQTAFGGAAPDP